MRFIVLLLKAYTFDNAFYSLFCIDLYLKIYGFYVAEVFHVFVFILESKKSRIVAQK